MADLVVNESKDSEALVLGIDIGTTSIKVSLLRNNTKEVVESFRFETTANISGEESNFAEQDVTKILSVLQHTLGQLSSQLLAKVSRIGVCGQMHGGVLWKGQTSLAMDWGALTANNVSNLITWEDRRCSNEFLSALPPTHTDITISTGFGCASLFWLQRNHLSLLKRYDCAGTIMDFIVCLLCQMEKPCMSSQNAVSWGYFDVDNMTWELELLKSANFPTHLLPVVVEPGAVAGKIKKPLLGIPAGIPVGVALGDFQCSVLSSISSWQSDAVLNVSTSCQLAVVVPDNVRNINVGDGVATESNALKLLPFFKGKKVITAASLSGGNVLATYVKMLMSWMEDLGLHSCLPSTDEIYLRILDCADKKGSTSLKIIPTLWGERHTPDKRGQVGNLISDNISLGDVGVALCQGLVKNLEKMMSKEFLHLQGVQRIVGTGSALVRNQVLQKQVEQVFGFPLEMSECSEASVGAALAAILECI